MALDEHSVNLIVENDYKRNSTKQISSIPNDKKIKITFVESPDVHYDVTAFNDCSVSDRDFNFEYSEEIGGTDELRKNERHN